MRRDMKKRTNNLLATGLREIMEKKKRTVIGMAICLLVLFLVFSFISFLNIEPNMSPNIITTDNMYPNIIITDNMSRNIITTGNMSCNIITTNNNSKLKFINGSGGIYPKNNGSPISVDSLLKKMELGSIAFNAPININIDDSPQIQLILSLDETIEKLKQSITEEGEKVGATIRVSDRMEARLSGYMFQITAITPEIQAVSKLQQTEWKWEIHPKEEGKHKLHLTLTALLEIDGRSTPRVIRTFDKIIEVNVTTTQMISLFFKNNWQWLWAAILVPIAGWLWKRKKKQLTITSS